MTSQTFDFHLPTKLNASIPPERRGLRRDQVKMMVLNKQSGQVYHDEFCQLEHYLQEGDLLVLNNSRTIPALLRARFHQNHQKKPSIIEVKLARKINEFEWEALILSDEVSEGEVLHFSPTLSATVLNKKSPTPLSRILFSKGGTELLEEVYMIGEPIRYEYIHEPWSLEYYQTVFATTPGSMEMPSAGRAISWELLFRLQKKGIQIAFLQLHTGLSYFSDDHLLPSPEENREKYMIPEVTMNKVLDTKKRDSKVIAVGTTVVRALETASKTSCLNGWTNLYITEESKLQLVDGIITGFHEPKASHLDMLLAFVPKEKLFPAYEEALNKQYLWHEFGDINVIL